MATSAPRFAIVLAGGVGSRFWPASRAERPKQLLPLGSDRPLILDTVRRAAALTGLEAVRVVASEGLIPRLMDACPDLDRRHFLVEPAPRNTGPALTWAAWEIERSHPGATLISLHSDHLIRPLEEFQATIARAVAAAERRGSLVCLGVEPDRPETDYGYIEIGEPSGDGTWFARRFVEKPDAETASRYAASGSFLWNTGIFVWRAADFLTAVRRVAPELSVALPALEREGPEPFFEAVAPISVDVAVMERSDRVEVARASFEWDDVGSWSALARSRAADDAENVLVGDCLAVESAGNVVWAEREGEAGDVVLFGVQGLVVVRSGGQTLVTSRDAARDLKRLIQRLDQGGA